MPTTCPSPLRAPCCAHRYAVHLHAVNDKGANGLKAALLLSLSDGHEVFAPQTIKRFSPAWISAFRDVKLSAGARVGTTITAADVGNLTRMQIRCSLKLSAALSAVEVTHATTGEAAFFVLSESKRRHKPEPVAPGSSEVIVTLTREPASSPIYRFVALSTAELPASLGLPVA